jgi:hypothetical protein
MLNPPSAQANAELALRAQAKRTAVFLIKHRARAYAQRPMTLETVFPGLSAAAPDTMAAVAKHLIETETQTPRRWFGFGGEVPILNARAVLLFARALRLALRDKAVVPQLPLRDQDQDHTKKQADRNGVGEDHGH